MLRFMNLRCTSNVAPVDLSDIPDRAESELSSVYELLSESGCGWVWVSHCLGPHTKILSN